MSKKSPIREFFNEKPPTNTAWRPEALALSSQFGKLLTIANRVFEGPACQLEVFDSQPARDGVELPAIRISYPNGAKLEFFDNLNIYAVSVTSPDCRVNDRFMKPAYCPEIDWSILYRPGMPASMAYPPRDQSPHRFTFKTHEHDYCDIQRMVTNFSWLQKQAMGLTQKHRSTQVQRLPEASGQSSHRPQDQEPAPSAEPQLQPRLKILELAA